MILANVDSVTGKIYPKKDQAQRHYWSQSNYSPPKPSHFCLRPLKMIIRQLRLELHLDPGTALSNLHTLPMK